MQLAVKSSELSEPPSAQILTFIWLHLVQFYNETSGVIARVNGQLTDPAAPPSFKNIVTVTTIRQVTILWIKFWFMQ